MQPLYSGILRCQGCGYVFADLNLSREDFFQLYRKSYFFGDEYSDYLAEKRALQRNFGLRFQVLQHYLDQERHKRLFEIGSAYGFFLDIARPFFDYVMGVDITEDGVRYAREELNLNVVQADLLECDFGDQRWDVVCMWDTIEHLSAPHLYVEKMSKHMASGALLAITTGDIDSRNARFKKDKWRLIHPPTHAHYFSRKTLARMLDNYGYDVIYSRYCGSYRSLSNVAHNILVLRQRRQKLYELLERTGILRFDVYLNLYDIIYVIARKR